MLRKIRIPKCWKIKLAKSPRTEMEEKKNDIT